MRDSRRAAVLVMTLWIAALVFMLAVAYLSLLERDSRLASRQNAEVVARQLAHAGLEAYGAGAVTFPIDKPDEPVTYKAGDDDPRNVIRLVRDPVNRKTTITGAVTDGSGRVVAQHTLIVPGDQLEAWYVAP